MSEQLVHKKNLFMFWLLTLKDDASYPSAAMYSSKRCSRRVLRKRSGCCVDGYSGHLEGNPDSTAFLLYRVASYLTLCFLEIPDLNFSVCWRNKDGTRVGNVSTVLIL